MSSKAGARAQLKREAKQARRAAAAGLLVAGTGAPLGAAVIVAPPADAASFTVTSNADSGIGSLRDAIAAANAAAGADTITVNTTGVITLTSGEIEITDDVTITGPGSAQLTIDAGGNSRIFNIHPATPDSTDAVVISGLTLANGSAPSYYDSYYHTTSQESGGAIVATGAYYVGTGSLTLDHVTMTGSSAGAGGALREWNSDLTVTNSTLSNNTSTGNGGAIQSWGGAVHITDSTFSANSAGGGGGGLRTGSGATSISRSSFTSNDAGTGGGIQAVDSLSLDGSVISGNTATASSGGGGLMLYGMYSSGGAVVSNSLISGNSATYSLYGGGRGGGALAESGGSAAIHFENVTMVDNSASGDGGAVYGSGNVDVSSSTLSGNSAAGKGGGLLSRGTGASVENSIIANNTASAAADGDLAVGDTLYDGAVKLDYSLVESIPTAGATTDVTPGSNIVGEDPQLGALADNGGPTQTMKPALSSPVIDQGKSFGLLHDQRGRNRPVDLASLANASGGDGADMGAVELSSTTDTPPAGTVQNSAAPTVSTVAEVGVPLTVSEGTWTPSDVTFDYQWYRGPSKIDGATSRSYTPVDADLGMALSVQVTGLKDGYTSTTVSSNQTDPVTMQGDVQNSTPPSVPAAAAVGAPITVSEGSWSPTGVTFTYQWYRGASVIPDATARTYTPVQADVGAHLSVVVTASKTGYNPYTASSNATNAVVASFGNAQNAAAPTIGGVAAVGSTLTESSGGSWSPGNVSLARQWLRNGVPIPGATGTSYVLSDADFGASVSLRVTASAPGYSPASATSAGTPAVAAGTLSTAGTGTVKGRLKVGKRVTAIPPACTPAPTAIAYQWLRNGKPIANATKIKYKLKRADKGKKISVRMTLNRTAYNAKTVTATHKGKVKG
jgi:predicted outer membrane repeat protein